MRASSLCPWFVLFGSSQLLGCSFLLDFQALKDNAEPAPGDDGGANRTTSSESLNPGAFEAGASNGDAGPMSSDVAPSDAPDASGALQSLDASSPALDGAVSSFDAGDAAACALTCAPPTPCETARCEAGQCLIEPKSCVATARCSRAYCEDGECKEEPTTGLVPAPYSEVLEAGDIYRSELVAGSDRYFRATYARFDGQPDIQLASFTETELLAGASVNAVAGASEQWQGWAVASPPALVTDTRVALDLHVYAALEPPLPAARPANQAPVGQVMRAKFNRNLVSSAFEAVSDVPNYRIPKTHRMGPAADVSSSGEPFVVWNGCTLQTSDSVTGCVTTEATGGAGGVYVQGGTGMLDVSDPGSKFIAETRTITALDALTSDAAIGATWLAAAGANQSEVRFGFSGGGKQPALERCTSGAGYALDASRIKDGLWGSSFSTRSGDKFQTEWHLLCATDSCEAPEVPPACTDPSGTKSQVSRSWQRPGDPEDQVWRATARVVGDNETSTLVLSVERVSVTLQPAGEDATLVDSVELATGTADKGPDWASLAALAPDSLAVSWLEPGSPDKLRVQTYALCSGE